MRRQCVLGDMFYAGNDGAGTKGQKEHWLWSMIEDGIFIIAYLYIIAYIAYIYIIVLYSAPTIRRQRSATPHGVNTRTSTLINTRRQDCLAQARKSLLSTHL